MSDNYPTSVLLDDLDHRAVVDWNISTVVGYGAAVLTWPDGSYMYLSHITYAQALADMDAETIRQMDMPDPDGIAGYAFTLCQPGVGVLVKGESGDACEVADIIEDHAAKFTAAIAQP